MKYPEMKRILYVMLLTVICQWVHAQSYDVDLSKLAKAHPASLRMEASQTDGSDVLLFSPAVASNAITVFHEDEKIEWSGKKYLVIDVVQRADYSGIIYIDFYRKGAKGDRVIVQQSGQSNKAELTPKIGVMPRLRTQVIFPLSYLDGQDIFMQRFPRQLKGTVLGRRLNIEDIGDVKMRIDPVLAPEYTPTMEIGSIRLTAELPEPLPKVNPVVDKFGQWAAKDWPGKTRSMEELKRKLTQLESSVEGSSFPKEWSRFGGWKKKSFGARGFFYTHHDGTRWWLVDPDGYAFVSAGVTGIDPGISGPVDGNEDLFEWLPSPEERQFDEAMSTNRNLKMVDFLKINLIRAYGKNWETKWQGITLNVMKKYRFNTIANWSNLAFANKAKLPYTIPLRDFPTTEKKLFRDFPDVYDPGYREHAMRFAQQLLPFKDDPYLIGYFLNNEPHWAFGEHYIAFEMFGTNMPSFSKKKFISWLEAKYDKVSALNNAWNISASTFDELESMVFHDPASVATSAMQDMKEFSGVLVDEYIRVVCEEVKKVDPNHLNLGLRYAWISSELCYRAGAFFDVFSINGYNFPGPPETSEIAKRSGKPILIGEYHFGSTDRGLPANGIQGAIDQKARGDAYQYYLENGFARPEVVALHYFKWNDQAIMGRFDGENYNIGFFDVCNQPYEDLLNASRKAHERMYEVAAKQRKPYSKIIKKVPPIFY
jgi:hypothetical protein